MSLLTIAGGICAALVVAFGVQTWRLERAQNEIEEIRAEAYAKQLEFERKARETEDRLRDEAIEVFNAKDKQLLVVSNDLDAALKRLRQRPERRADAATPAAASGRCAGSSGAELSGRDAEFLSRFAAERDEIAVRLTACQGWVRTVTSALKGESQ